MQVTSRKHNVSVVYDAGDSLAEAVNRFGEDFVLQRFQEALRRDIAELIRSLHERGLGQAEIQAAVTAYRPRLYRGYHALRRLDASSGSEDP